MTNSRAISVIPKAIVMLALLLWAANREADKLAQETLKPDFSAINDIKIKKRTFFAYILPLVQHSNKEISQNQ